MSYTYKFPMQSVTADIAVFHKDESSKYDILLLPIVRYSVLLIKRNTTPFKGMYALPGGFLDEEDDDTEVAAHRELKEEVGIEYDSDGVLASGFVGFYSSKKRDPRSLEEAGPERVCTAAYYYVVSELPELSINKEEVQVAEWINITQIIDGEIDLAFDHKKIVMQAIHKMSRQLGESTEQFAQSLRRGNDTEKGLKGISKLATMIAMNGNGGYAKELYWDIVSEVKELSGELPEGYAEEHKGLGYDEYIVNCDCENCQAVKEDGGAGYDPLS